MAEMYGSYSDEDLNGWERMPQNIRVLTSSAFGAWLLRRDKRIKEQEPKTDTFDKIRAEIAEKENALNCTKVSDVALKVAYIEVLKIIDKYRQEG